MGQNRDDEPSRWEPCIRSLLHQEHDPHQWRRRLQSGSPEWCDCGGWPLQTPGEWLEAQARRRRARHGPVVAAAVVLGLLLLVLACAGLRAGRWWL
jgi:hypothetical protein